MLPEQTVPVLRQFWNILCANSEWRILRRSLFKVLRRRRLVGLLHGLLVILWHTLFIELLYGRLVVLWRSMAAGSIVDCDSILAADSIVAQLAADSIVAQLAADSIVAQLAADSIVAQWVANGPAADAGYAHRLVYLAFGGDSLQQLGGRFLVSKD